MKKPTESFGAAVGLAAGTVIVALTYLGHRLAGLPYLPFDLFEWLARVLPGGLIARTIDAMVAVIRGLHLGPTAAAAKLAEKGLALAEFAAIWIIFGILLVVIGKVRPRRPVLAGALGGLALWVASAGVEYALGFPDARPAPALLWLAACLIGGGALLGRIVSALMEPPATLPATDGGRRRFLGLVGSGSFVIIVSAAGVSLLAGKGRKAPIGLDRQELLEAARTSGPAASPPPAELEGRFPPVPGTRPELTANRDFYRIDIDLMPPKIDGRTWRLKLGGLVDRPLVLSLEDLRSRPRQTQALTLSCISNPVGGDLIGTSVWTGTPFKAILDEAGLKKDVREIFIESADGFYESVPLAEALDPRTLLVDEMNGEPLSADHGYPLRIFIPGHFGMKQPKWIVSMEAIDHKGRGFWVDRDWSPTAFVRTTSVIDAVAARDRDAASGIVPVGGIAYSGAKGISRVEVQADDGPWDEAELRRPALSPLTWVQWRYLWKAAPGKHILRVRAYDGDGTMQATDERPPSPDGATGIHERPADISK